jgi:predicted DNA-binding transcriptional regulator YafY
MTNRSPDPRTLPVDLRNVDAVGPGARSGDPARLLHDLRDHVLQLEKLMRIVILLVAQNADPTHLSIEAAARALGVSTKTIRRRIAAGSLTLETIPGSRRCGIRIDEIYDGWWVPLALARKLVEEERDELQALKTKSR